MSKKNTGKKKDSFNAAFNKQPTQAPQKDIADSARKTRRLVITFVALIASAAILVGAILGTVIIVKNSSYVIKSGNVGLTEGVANYFITEFKAQYVATNKLSSNQLFVYNEAEFWKSNGISAPQSEYLRYYIEESMKQLVAANALFDKYATLTSEDKNEIALTISSIVNYRASGSKDQFNRDTEKYGFDYDDFKDAIEMLYKASSVKRKIFGSDGAGVANFPEHVEKYFSGYARAKIVFIRTSDTFVFDESGNRVKGDDGNDELRPLTEKEISERVEYIGKLDDCIAGIKDGTVAPERYDELVDEIYTKYKENISGTSGGYYFHSDSDFTAEFSEAFADIVTKVFSLDIGEGDYVEYGAIMAEEDDKAGGFVGRAYVMRMSPEENAYLGTDKNGFFEDFYVLAASSLYSEMLTEHAKAVELRDKWKEIDLTAHAYTSNYGV